LSAEYADYYGQDLPTELIIYILELANVNGDEYPDETLKSCSLVCTSWQDPAQRLIFRSGCLHPLQSTAQQLVQLFTGSAHGLVLASYVRRIDAEIRQSAEPKYSHCHSFDELLTIISLFPNLYEIALRCYDRFEFLQPVINHTIPSLRGLEFSPDGDTSFSLLYHLLS
jgi:hypothetical protein